jgi:hypothetical protein
MAGPHYWRHRDGSSRRGEFGPVPKSDQVRRRKVATEMALHVLAYNLTRVMNIVGIKPLLTATKA